jgi:hypothetical protein
MSETTQWWWLRYFGVETWSLDERRARISLGMAAMVVSVIVLIAVGLILEWLGCERHLAPVIGALVGVPTAIVLARPIVQALDADVLRRGDENAARRLTAPK